MPKSVLLLQMMDVLRERPGLSITQMAAILGRSERTIYRYLETLSDDLHVPVYCERGGYHIADRFVPGRLDLSPKEVLAVRLALTTGALRRSGPFTEYALSAWRKIELALTADSLESVRTAVRRHSIYTPVYSAEEIEPETLRCLMASVEQNKRLSVVYRSQRSGEVRTLTIDPYALVFRRHNWYLIAFSLGHGRTVQLKLVRIVKASTTGEAFQMPHDFTVDSFYAKSWEMWTGGDECIVRVKFSPRVAPIIRETKRHPTQELQDTSDGGVIFSVKVAGIEEIGFWVLSWGSDAEVLDPPEFRASVQETARKMLETYSRSASAWPESTALEGSKSP